MRFNANLCLNLRLFVEIAATSSLRDQTPFPGFVFCAFKKRRLLSQAKRCRSIFTFKAKERECLEIYRIQPHLTCVLAIKNVGKRGLFKIVVQV